MDKFTKKNGFQALHGVPRPKSVGWIWLIFFLFLAVCAFYRPNIVMANKNATVAVLPFRVHAPKPFGHLKLGLQEMINLRIAEKGFQIIRPEIVNKHPLAFSPIFKVSQLIKVGKDLKADWIIFGSLTKVGEKISLDLKVVDVNKLTPPSYVFMVAESIDALADTVKRIVTSIDNQISGLVQVDSVRVQGNKRIEKDAILEMVNIKKGDRLDYDRLDKDLREIYKMGFFKDVKIETEDGARGKIVTFKVTEKPSVSKIVFNGNKKIKDDDLKKEVGIKLYSILDYSEIKQSINRLRDYYRQKAYYNVDIKDKIEPLPNNEVLLKYDIAEHKKVYITKIKFHGNAKYDDDDLKDIMETSEKGFFSWVTKSGYLDKKKLEFDAQKITSFYHNHGFIKAKVGAPKISYQEDEGLKIDIEIKEGPQYGVNMVDVTGDLIKPREELLKIVQIGKQKVFNREIVREDTLALRNVYVDDGFAYAEVLPKTKENDKTHLVDITYNLSKGHKVRFERINVSGNTSTRDKVIRRELKVIEGEFFSGKALRKSTENLHRLGFFEDVKVQTKKGSRDDLMVLDVKVKERSTGSFSIGAGYSSRDNVFGTLQIGENNLFGYGQRLKASAKIGGKTSEYDIRFVEPWLFNSPLSAGIDLYKWKYEYDEYTKDSLGGALTFGFPLGIDDFTRGSVRYDYDDADITDVGDNAAVEIKDMEGKNVTSSTTFRIRRDSRDRLWNTNKGSINSISFQYAGGFLSGDVYFNKYLARSAWYFPLFWKTVFLIQGRWGYVEQRSGGTLPVYQKFRIGGINTLRGFDYASISPLDPVTGDRIGGEKKMIYNVEYRFPLFKEQGIFGLVFFDAGNVYTKDEDYTFDDIRTSTGCGIRWYSPMGPLRLEYGRNLDQREGEASGKWEFSIGGAF